MIQYHKIQTVFFRDPATKHKTLLEGQYSRPEFEFLKDNPWVFTEKVDGTNIRVIWDGKGGVRYEGKTDRANTPSYLLDKLAELFPVSKFVDAQLPPMCLYGEGYGAKIQGGGGYIPDGQSFILFDVSVEDVWLERSNVVDIAGKLEVKAVPIIGEGKLLEAVEMARAGFDSTMRDQPPEGLVMRPRVELRSRRGERIITKIKLRDFVSS